MGKNRKTRTFEVILGFEEFLLAELQQALHRLLPEFHQALVVIWLVQVILQAKTFAHYIVS